jgi:hypothetical protein
MKLDWKILKKQATKDEQRIFILFVWFAEERLVWQVEYLLA